MPSSDDSGLAGLARNWLRAKKTELLTTNNRTRADARANEQAAQDQVVERSVTAAAMTAFPGLRRMQERQEAAAAEREARARDEVLGLPLANVTIHTRGVVTESGSGPLPTRVTRDQDLLVEVLVLDDLAPQLGSTPFYGCGLRIPNYQGPGTYDLVTIARHAEATGNEFEYFDWHIDVGSRDEAFYWTPDVGPGVIEVAPGERSINAQLMTQGASGDLQVALQIELPAS
jgi:hypothetical protein